MAPSIISAIFGGSQPSVPVKNIEEIQPLAAPIEELQGAMKDGTVLLPESEDYDRRRTCWNYDTTGSPSAIAMARSEEDVVEVVKFVAKHNVDMCIAGGKHSLYASRNNTLQLNLEMMDIMEVDPEAKIATVGPGVRLREFDEACSKYGLAATAGANPDTGVIGLTLGGGVGYLVRRFGMTIDHVISARVVLASGEVVYTSKEENQDLLWALCGGGGNFGVVTEMKYTLHPIGTNGQVVAGAMVYLPFTLARLFMEAPLTALLKHKEYWVSGDMPDTVSPLVILAGRGPFVCVYAMCGEVEEGLKIKENVLNKIARTKINTIKPIPYKELQGIAEKDQLAGAWYEKSFMGGYLTDEILEVLWNQSQKAPNKGCSIVIHPLGGGFERVKPEETAFYFREAKTWLIILGKWDYGCESAKTAVIEWCKETANMLLGWTQNYYQSLGSVDDKVTIDSFDIKNSESMARCFGKNYEKLKNMKRKYDPNNMFKFNRNIKLEGEQ
eukprot:Nk52_evm8s238 gene=Nk52_evmTU8s238